MLDTPPDSPLTVLEEQVRDLYNAKNQLLKALPTLAKRATSESLRMAMQGLTEEGMEVLPASESKGQQQAASPEQRSSR